MKFFKKLFGIPHSTAKSGPDQIKGPTIEETFARFSNHQQMVAIHEAGHVIGALYMDAGTPLYVQLNDKDGPEWSGKTKYDFSSQLEALKDEQELSLEQNDKDVQYQEQILDIARMRYGIAMAGPIAQAKFQNVGYLNIRNLRSHKEGEDINICVAVEKEIDRLGLDSLNFTQKLDKEINEYIQRQEVWYTIVLIAQALLIAKNHKLTKQEIDSILASHHFPH